MVILASTITGESCNGLQKLLRVWLLYYVLKWNKSVKPISVETAKILPFGLCIVVY